MDYVYQVRTREDEYGFSVIRTFRDRQIAQEFLAAYPGDACIAPCPLADDIPHTPHRETVIRTHRRRQYEPLVGSWSVADRTAETTDDRWDVEASQTAMGHQIRRAQLTDSVTVTTWGPADEDVMAAHREVLDREMPA